LLSLSYICAWHLKISYPCLSVTNHIPVHRPSVVENRSATSPNKSSTIHSGTTSPPGLVLCENLLHLRTSFLPLVHTYDTLMYTLVMREMLDSIGLYTLAHLLMPSGGGKSLRFWLLTLTSRYPANGSQRESTEACHDLVHGFVHDLTCRKALILLDCHDVTT